jgi:hypothetical protein
MIFLIHETLLFLVRLCRSHSKGEHYNSEASEIEHRAHSLEPTIRDGTRAFLEMATRVMATSLLAAYETEFPYQAPDTKLSIKYTPSKLRNCSPVEGRAPEFTKEFRGELSGDAVVDSRDRGPVPHSEAQDMILIAFELGSLTTSFLRFTIETSMLLVGDLRRQLACELKQTERLLYIFFGTTVLKDDSKIVKCGLGRHFRAYS